ncbi:L,D-transpeptidase [Agrobacterium vitis]|uniref:L,D-transpeptidase n=1 Tax=Agrobacterium vitis TaxID=373 RepID=UPI0012E8A803|nr:L,D-transpeptidase family protein [Agrobacterium vitis]NSZ55026.1 L,D-transpeptidase [Agrobacterium vitis]NTA34018.1 L,D-transpeptidase [Agrobacterium vitis]
MRMRGTGVAMAALMMAALALPASGSAAAPRADDPASSTASSVVTPQMMKREVPDKFKRRLVRLKTDEAPGTVIIDTNNKFLYLVEGNNRAIRYGVGVGREGFGWSGVVNIGRKVEWPSWRPPEEMRVREARRGHILPVVQEGGPDNPLGARAMYLYKGNRDTIFRIHGTNQPWSIGLNLSSGCIRMNNKDVEDLYARAEIGSKVIVVGPGNKQGEVSFDDRGIDLLRTIFGG